MSGSTSGKTEMSRSPVLQGRMARLNEIIPSAGDFIVSMTSPKKFSIRKKTLRSASRFLRWVRGGLTPLQWGDWSGYHVRIAYKGFQVVNLGEIS